MTENHVIEEICKLYKNEVEKNICLLNHLSNSGMTDGDFKMLELLLESSKDFKDYCNYIISKNKEKENDQFARNNLQLAKYIDLSKTGAELAKWAEDNRGALTGVDIGVAKFWCSLPPESQKQIIVYIGEWNAQYASIMSFEIAGSWPLLPSAFGYFIKAFVGLDVNSLYGLAVIYLAYGTFRSIYIWYKGKLSGKRVTKNIIDDGLTLAGAYFCGTTCATVGSEFGLVGIVVGSIVGGIAGSMMAETLSDMFTRKIFNLPKNVSPKIP